MLQTAGVVSSPYRRSAFANLGATAPFFLSLWGWAALAVAMSPRGPVAAIALLGLLAALFAKRAPWATVIIEAIAFSAAVAVTPRALFDFVVAGGVLVVLARGILTYLRFRPAG